MLGTRATVVVAELLPEIVRWNQVYLGELTHHPLQDPRVILKIDDVAHVIQQSPGVFDTILLDIDNGPKAITDIRNSQLYNQSGIQACIKALRSKGCLAVWSLFFYPTFEHRLRQAQLHVRCLRVATHKGARPKHCYVWVASKDRNSTLFLTGQPYQG